MTIFIYEHEVIEYLYKEGKITAHQKRSFNGYLKHSNWEVTRFIEKTRLFDLIDGDFGCGVACCGHKTNFKLR